MGGGARVPYQVRFVDDADLPRADWAIATTDDGTSYFFIKRSRLSPELLAEAWEAWDNRGGGGGGRCYSIARRLPAAVNA